MNSIQDIKIRKAKKEDLNYLVKFSNNLLEYHIKLDNYYKLGKAVKNRGTLKFLSDKLKQRNSVILIAEKNGLPIGFFMGSTVMPLQFMKRKIGIILDAFVVPKYRRLGIGEKGIVEMTKWFKSKSVKNIEASVHIKNKIGIKAWKKFGFDEFLLRMRMDLK